MCSRNPIAAHEAMANTYKCIREIVNDTTFFVYIFEQGQIVRSLNKPLTPKLISKYITRDNVSYAIEHKLETVPGYLPDIHNGLEQTFTVTLKYAKFSYRLCKVIYVYKYREIIKKDGVVYSTDWYNIESDTAEYDLRRFITSNNVKANNLLKHELKYLLRTVVAVVPLEGGETRVLYSFNEDRALPLLQTIVVTVTVVGTKHTYRYLRTIDKCSTVSKMPLCFITDGPASDSVVATTFKSMREALDPKSVYSVLNN